MSFQRERELEKPSRIEMSFRDGPPELHRLLGGSFQAEGHAGRARRLGGRFMCCEAIVLNTRPSEKQIQGGRREASFSLHFCPRVFMVAELVPFH